MNEIERAARRAQHVDAFCDECDMRAPVAVVRDQAGHECPVILCWTCMEQPHNRDVILCCWVT